MPVPGTPLPSRLDVPLSPNDVLELRALGPDAYIIECLPGVERLPAGVHPSKPLGWPQTHPGYHILADGRCALDPDATPIPLSPAPVD